MISIWVSKGTKLFQQIHNQNDSIHLASILLCGLLITNRDIIWCSVEHTPLHTPDWCWSFSTMLVLMGVHALKYFSFWYGVPHTGCGFPSMLCLFACVTAVCFPVWQVHAINESNRFEAEIRQEQEVKKKQAEEQKQRRAAFKELQSAFKWPPRSSLRTCRSLCCTNAVSLSMCVCLNALCVSDNGSPEPNRGSKWSRMLVTSLQLYHGLNTLRTIYQIKNHPFMSLCGSLTVSSKIQIQL